MIYLFGNTDLLKKNPVKTGARSGLEFTGSSARAGASTECTHRLGSLELSACFFFFLQSLSRTDEIFMLPSSSSGVFCPTDTTCACAVCKILSCIPDCTHPTRSHTLGDVDLHGAGRTWLRSIGLLLTCQISKGERLFLCSVILIY